MKKYRDEKFDFTVREIAFADRVRNRWAEEQAGTLVEAVKEGGWAALGHLAVGDLILEVDRHATPDVASLGEQMSRLAGERPRAVLLHVQRGIHSLYLELEPEWPAPAAAEATGQGTAAPASGSDKP